MKTKEFDKIIDNVLEEETKKLIMESIHESNGNLIDIIKRSQTLSGLVDKISAIKDSDTVTLIKIEGVTPEELVKCCGGDSLGKAQTNLMQGLHHDLDESGYEGNYDIDVDTQGDENSLVLLIRISTNDDEFSKEIDEVEDNGEASNMFGQAMFESDPTVDDKSDDMILGSEDEICDTPKSKEFSKKLKKMNESTKKTVTLTEAEMAAFLTKTIKESVDNDGTTAKDNMTPTTKGVPGLDVTNKAIKDSGKENNDALKMVEKKIKNYLQSFDGEEQPDGEDMEQYGKGEEKVAAQNTSEEDEVVAAERGRNSADLTYQQTPSKNFQERAKLSLVGSAKMGNSHEYANVVNPKSTVGKDILDNSEKRKEAYEEEPIYNKESVPVNTKTKDNKNRPGEGAVAGEILRMKQMAGYTDKTQ